MDNNLGNNSEVNSNISNNQYNPENMTINNTIKTNFDGLNQPVSNSYIDNDESLSEDNQVKGSDYFLAIIAKISGKLLYVDGLFIAFWIFFGGLSGGGKGYYYTTLISAIIVFVVLLTISLKFSKNVIKVRKKHYKTIRLIAIIIALLYIVITTIIGRK